MVSGGVTTGVGFNVGLGLEGNPASSPNVVAGAVLDEVEGKTLLPFMLLNTKARLSERVINLNNIGAISTFSGYSLLIDSTAKADWVTLHPEVAGQANITSDGVRSGSGIDSILTTKAAMEKIIQF
ncbi:MAG: hypothetical protein ACREBD_31995 [Blastocatellia bacterium]